VVPTNVLWANRSPRVTGVRVIAATGDVLTVSTTTFMHDRVVKSAVPAPERYFIDAEKADLFIELLRSHGIAYEILSAPMTLVVERSKQSRMEERFDEVYHRYAGRQVVEAERIKSITFASGTVMVDIGKLDTIDARRALMLLEPRQLFGLYQWPIFRDAVSAEGTLPVCCVRKSILNESVDE
jgi:hypothetical protein